MEGYAQIYLPWTVLEIVLKTLASHLPVAISGSGVSLQIDATCTTESWSSRRYIGDGEDDGEDDELNIPFS